MYKKILSAVNEHINSEISARYAMNLARACKAKLHLCFIAEKGMSASSISLAEEAVKRLFITAREMDIKVESITETGEPLKEIERIVKQEGIDIAFAATRREDIEKRFYTGTFARRLSLNLPCSVALVRAVHIGRLHPNKILVPLKGGFSHIKERAHFIAKIAEAFGSKVFVFHATKPITKFFHGEMHITPLEWEKRLPENIADFMKHLKRHKIEYEGKLLPGAVARSITIEAASKKHDLIIMGASERSLLSSIFKGNPVEAVLREAPCNLIILRSRLEGR